MLAYDSLEVTRGGYEGDFLFLEQPGLGRVECRDASLEETLAAVGHPALEAQLREIRRNVAKRRRRRLTGILLIVGIFLSIGLLIWKTPALLAGMATELPIELDKELGDAAFSTMELPGARVDDAALRGLSDEIIARLRPHAAVAELDLRVAIVASEDPNAFALPGGQIVLLTGLVTTADAADEVAAVLAHEIAHATLRHGLRNVVHQASSALALQLFLGDAGGLGELAGEAAWLASTNAYSREQEAAADAEGARMMAAAGLEPMALARFFERMSEIPGSELKGGLSWLSSHPEHAERRRAIANLTPSLPRGPRAELQESFAAAQEAAERLAGENDLDEEEKGSPPTPRQP